MYKDSDISEADYMASTENWTDYDERADIAEAREIREHNLIGKYIVVTDGKKGIVFLQDKRISKKHHWTKFLSNAISFTNKESAAKEVSKFKFNNPRVMLVDNMFKMQKVEL